MCTIRLRTFSEIRSESDLVFPIRLLCSIKVKRKRKQKEKKVGFNVVRFNVVVVVVVVDIELSWLLDDIQTYPGNNELGWLPDDTP